MDFEYILVSVNGLTASRIKNTNTLVDNIFLADTKRTKKEWMDGIPELMRRIRAMDKEDLNEWSFKSVQNFINEIKPDGT